VQLVRTVSLATLPHMKISSLFGFLLTTIIIAWFAARQSRIYIVVDSLYKSATSRAWL